MEHIWKKSFIKNGTELDLLIGIHKVGIKKAECKPKNNNKEEGTKFVRNSVSEIENKLCSNNKLKKSSLSEN